MEPHLELAGPDGRNPMGYFAALGALSALTRMQPERRPRLSWTVAPIPRPVLHGFGGLEDLVAALDDDRRGWAASPALFFGSHEDVKFSAEDQRAYLRTCRAADDGGRSAGLGAALVAEGAFAGNRDGKPTDLHFTAGQQRFLRIARTLQDEVGPEDLAEALAGPWAYSAKAATFGWDVADDRIYALSASDPSKDAKFTVPGADWLALLGISAFPVLAEDKQARPAGSHGTWKTGSFAWPLWDRPLAWSGVVSLINSDEAAQLTAGLGVYRRMRSLIRRSDQGGYGSFSPSSVDWEAAADS